MNSIYQYASSSNQRQEGFSLVEVLVALMISLFLIAGVIQLFIGSKQSYRFYDALSRIQENGRFALEAISGDIRMADYRPTPIPENPNPPPNKYSLPTTPIGRGSANENDILIQWLDPCPPSPALCTPRACPAADGICSRRYFVGPRTAGSTAPTCPSAATSLLVDRGDGAGPQELIEGVQAIQVLYGICDTDTDGDALMDTVTPPYRNAKAVTDSGKWLNVCSVRINLLVVSLENNIVATPQTILFPAETATVFPVNDRCLRQAFSTTVRIRNRMP